jgi:predicted short-subunit dehydrogenase-like oxidoreductase (DUF2520 family)
VGTVLARLLHEAGHEFLGAVGRTRESARACCEFASAGTAAEDPAELVPDAELLFLTVPDDRIEDVCCTLADRGLIAPRSVVVHCSGALPSGILHGASEAGARVAAIHPLQTFADPPEAVDKLAGAYCCVEGDAEALPVLCSLAESLGMHPLTVSAESKALYHAAAVTACNYLVSLQDIACDLVEAAGIQRKQAIPALLPLIRATVDNLESRGIPGALTGPIARGDVDTVRGHLEAMETATPDIVPMYRLLGRRAVELALHKGTLAPDDAERLKELLQ